MEGVHDFGADPSGGLRRRALGAVGDDVLAAVVHRHPPSVGEGEADDLVHLGGHLGGPALGDAGLDQLPLDEVRVRAAKVPHVDVEVLVAVASVRRLVVVLERFNCC